MDHSHATVRVIAYDASGQHVPAHDFDLASDHDVPLGAGIAYASGRFYVPHQGPGSFDFRVRAYDASGQRMPVSDFDLLSNHLSPDGITYAAGEDAFYLIGEDDIDVGTKVFRYDGPGLAGTCVAP